MKKANACFAFAAEKGQNMEQVATYAGSLLCRTSKTSLERYGQSSPT